jgi:putative transposase
VTFQKTGLNSIFGCIKHSLCSHHMAYDLWPEIENPWPSFGLGRMYLSDRGRDFQSLKYLLAIRELGSDYELSERYTPWVKASIERFFLTLEQTFFECLPGRTFANLQLRGDYNAEQDAVIRFSTLVYLLHKWAADYHNVTPHSRHLARPLDLWMEGIGIAPPPYPKSPDVLDIILGEGHQGTLSHEGIRYQWMNYASDQLNDLMRDLGKGISLNYVVTPENLGAVHVLDPRTKSYFLVPNTRPDYAEGLSAFQHKYIRKEAAIWLKGKVSVDGLIETRARIAEVTQEELFARKSAKKAELARIAGINSNAVLEGRPRSIQTPFQGQQLDPSEAQNTISNSISWTNVPTYQWGL